MAMGSAVLNHIYRMELLWKLQQSVFLELALYGLRGAAPSPYALPCPSVPTVSSALSLTVRSKQVGFPTVLCSALKPEEGSILCAYNLHMKQRSSLVGMSLCLWGLMLSRLQCQG